MEQIEIAVRNLILSLSDLRVNEWDLENTTPDERAVSREVEALLYRWDRDRGSSWF